MKNFNIFLFLFCGNVNQEKDMIKYPKKSKFIM